MNIKLKVLRISGNPGSQLVKFGIIAGETELLAARLTKEANSNLIEFWPKVVDIGLTEGQQITVDLEFEDADGPTPLPVETSVPTPAVAEKPSPDPSVAEKLEAARQESIRVAEEKLEQDAADLAKLQSEKPSANDVPPPPAPNIQTVPAQTASLYDTTKLRPTQ